MLIVRGLIGGLIQVALLGTLLLAPAGTWQWPRALQFLAAYGVVLTISIVTLARLAPASLERRLTRPAAENQPLADRIITPLLIATLFAWMVFIPIDVFRLHLLPPPPAAVSILGAIVCAADYAVIWASLFQNAFAAPVVSDQSERGQVLVDRGVYAFVRHPFYLGFVIFFAGLGLWLESTASVIALLLVVAVLVARITVEEKTLRETLPGYDEYTRKVRRRLVPLLW